MPITHAFPKKELENRLNLVRKEMQKNNEFNKIWPFCYIDEFNKLPYYIRSNLGLYVFTIFDLSI